MRVPLRDGLAQGWKIERRPSLESRAWHRVVAVALGLFASLAFGVIVSGSSLVVFEDLWLFSFGSPTGIEDVATLSVPLIMTGLAAAIPLRLGLWNIGAEGQLFIGAWAAAGIAFLFPSLGWPLLVPLMLAASLIGGALWVLLPAIARVRFNVNEIITTLLLNFVAVFWVIYWAGEPWRDPTSVGGVKSKLIPSQAELPQIPFGEAEVPIGFFIATAVAVIAWLILRQTTLGYEVTMLGASPGSARFAGIPTRKLLIYSLLVGGAMAGLAGTLEMMGNQLRFGSALSSNTGYTGIVVAVLAGGSAIGVVAMAIVFALIAIVGGIMRAEGTSSDIIFAMYGITLIVASIAQGMSSFRLVRRPPPETEQRPPEEPRSGDQAAVEETRVG